MAPRRRPRKKQSRPSETDTHEAAWQYLLAGVGVGVNHLTLDLKNGREIIEMVHNDKALRRRLCDENPRFARLLQLSLEKGARGMIAIDPEE